MNKIPQVLLLSVLLSGCGSFLKSDYQQPMLSVPPQWRVQDTGPNYLKNTAHWWDNFDDPLLSDSIKYMLLSNNDLAKATLTLRQAQLTAGLSNTNLTPDVAVSGTGTNSKSLSTQTEPIENYSLTSSLSYELDLWGKLARTREQSEWLVKASEQDRQNTALTMIGTLAQLYWQIAKYNQQLTYGKEAIDISERTLRMVQSRYSAGNVGRLDLLQAQQSVLSNKNQYRALQQQLESSRNAFALMFNRSPLDRLRERSSLDLNQNVPVAQRLPLEVISHRPDVQSAEWQLRSALAGYDVARLSFYPSVSLSASLNAGSDIFSQWFTNPSRVLGSNIALPFVEWNTVQLTIDKSGVDVQQAAINFRVKVYTALQDVDNAMEQRLSSQMQRDNERQDLVLSRQRLALTQSQYEAGSISFQTLLDAQTSVISSETSLSEQQYNYLYATMQLWLALGGGADTNKSKGAINE
jgi:NodT family efflux transporter outer membrane factor (OMF) lipoprotein